MQNGAQKQALIRHQQTPTDVSSCRYKRTGTDHHTAALNSLQQVQIRTLESSYPDGRRVKFVTATDNLSDKAESARLSRLYVT